VPLAFDSRTCGRIAFGFFNIDSDMLLLERTFFFASDFCEKVAATAGRSEKGPSLVSWGGWEISDPRDVGDLMGAIRGVRHVGFIGESYRRFPFPDRPEGFEQKPEGWRTRAEMEEMISRWGAPIRVDLALDPDADDARLGPCSFTGEGFLALVEYVRLGGYPRWRGGEGPAYVAGMIDAIERSAAWPYRRTAG